MKLRLLACLAGLLAGPLAAQTHDAVALEDPVYHVLTMAQARGWLPLMSGSKPYSRSTVLRALGQVLGADGPSAVEKGLLTAQVARLNGTGGPARPGRIVTDTAMGPLAASLSPVFSWRQNSADLSNFEMSHGLATEFAGDIGNAFTYRLWAGLTWDRIAPDMMYGAVVQGDSYRLGDPGGWAPYQFVKTYDGFHQGLSGVNDDGIQKYRWGYHHQSEAVFQAFDDALTLRFARVPREWGQGDGSLTLSGTAPPMSAIEAQLKPASWVSYSWLLATAGDWFNETAATGVTEDKMFSVQRLELQPFPWLQFSVSDTVVFSKRFELDYVNPFMIALFAQNLHGDWDNVGLSAEAAAVLPGAGKAYASVYVDEITPGDLSDVRNIVAWQGGVSTPLPWLPWTSASFQYVKIEPFTYAHYPQELPSSTRPVSLSNTTQGMNLFYNLPPNSDEWMLRLESAPVEEWSGRLTYKLIRHGTNSLNPDGSQQPGLIYGGVGQPIDYALYDAGGYGKKHFLEDGVYDITNLASWELRWAPNRLPVVLTASLTLAHTFFDPNDTGITVPQPVTQTVFALGATVF